MPKRARSNSRDAFDDAGKDNSSQTAPCTVTQTCEACDELDGLPPDNSDTVNYFEENRYLYHQMNMLEDGHRMGVYYNAIMRNPGCFQDKVVLDVGAGTCILAIWAARAGATQVLAIEATDMAQRGKRIVEANGLAGVIRVIQGTVETVTLPCKVDVIVSEWMGRFLLGGGMLDSLLIARDRFLKPGGALFPSHATLYLAPITSSKTLKAKQAWWESQSLEWPSFSGEMKGLYGLDFSCVQGDFIKEERQYEMQTGAFANLKPKSLMGPATTLLELDLRTCSAEELKNPTRTQSCAMILEKGGRLEGFCGFFEAFFHGAPEQPVQLPQILTTAPAKVTSTHWGQQVFGFYPPLQVKKGDVLDCAMKITRRDHNHRLLRLEAKFSLLRATEKAVVEQRTETFFVD